MVTVALGVLAAIVAACLYNLAVVVQAKEVRTVPLEHSMQVSLLGRLLRRPRWVAAVGIDVFAVALQGAALMLAPLTVVQPADAAGLVVLLIAGAQYLKEPVGRREWAAVAGIGVGVAVLALAAPERSTDHADGAALLIPLLALGVVALIPFLLARTRRGIPPVVMVLGAGLAFAWSAFGIKLISDHVATGAWAGAVAWAIPTFALGAVGTVSEMSAFQHWPATRVAPVVFVIELVVPVGLAVFIGGEAWNGGLGQVAALSAGLALVVGCAAALAASDQVAGMMSAEAGPVQDGGTKAPDAPGSASARTCEAADGADAGAVSGASGAASADRSADDSSARDVATSAKP